MKGVYDSDIIKKWQLFSKKCSRELIDRNCSDNDVGGVAMLESATEDNKLFHIFFFKEPDSVMNIMSLWVTIGDLEGGDTKHKYKSRDDECLVSIFKDW